MGAVITVIDTLYAGVIQISTAIIAWFFREYVNASVREEISQAEMVGVGEIQNGEGQDDDAEKTTSFKSIEDIIAHTPVVTLTTEKNTVMYTQVRDVPVYRNPTIEFDAEIARVPYGEMVIVLEPRGRFYRVAWRDREGWVLKDDLAGRAATVYPEFALGAKNLIDDPNTIQVRSLLGDPFGLRESDFPLQAGEYILYRLWKKGIEIMWGDERPRMPGMWHKLLRGQVGVHVGMIPKSGEIMEYVSTADIGHLAFIENVYPDQSIELSEVNHPDSGIYNERRLTKDEWKELKPVFISIH